MFPLQAIKAVFHLYIPQEAPEKVQLQFSNQPETKKDLTVSLTCDKEHGADGKYWKSESIFFDPDEVETLRYKYIVKYRQGIFNMVWKTAKNLTWKILWFWNEKGSDKTEPVDSNPVETASKETEPANTKPVETESKKTDPVEAEPGKTQPGETESDDTKPVENEFDESEYSEAEFRQPIQSGNNYDVFKKPDHDQDNEWVFEGQLFYVKMFYSYVNEKNLNEMMIKCERVGFANPNSTLVDRSNFFEWVSKTARSPLTPSKSAYMCALLNQCLKIGKSKYRLCDFLPNSKETVDTLLLELGLWHKERLTSISSHFTESIDNLLPESSCENTLGYILVFCPLFDGTTIISSVKSNHLLSVTDEEGFEDISTKIVNRLMGYKDRNKLNTLLNFVITESPSIVCLFKLSRVLETNSCLTDLDEPVLSKFTQLLAQERKPADLLETAVWKYVPNALKPKLANQFCDVVTEQLKTRTSSFNYAVLKDLILDKDLQQWATTKVVKLLMLTASSSNKGLPDVTCEVLNSHNFYSFWNNMNLKDKESTIQELLLKKMQARQNELSTNKQKVVGAFQVLQELSEILAIKQCKELMESIEKCVCQKTQGLGLEAILDAYDDIQSSFKKISGRPLQWYVELITLEAEQLQALTNDVKFKLIEVVRSSGPFTSSSQCIEIDG